MTTRSTPSVAAIAVAVALIVGACAAGASATPSPTASAAPRATTAPTDAASEPAGVVVDPSTPTGCIGLAPQECARARAFAATTLAPGEPAPTYVQVGPFGCAVAEPCPETLLSRPEGDVVIELAGGIGVNVHLVVAADGSFDATRSEGMGIAVPPASSAEDLDGGRPLRLGHCGIFSGIDVDGSWWDPVGQVSFASGEAVNETAGILTLTDPDHGEFSGPGGFRVQLVRHDGPKFLPFCM